MLSVNTNYGAMIALQNLNKTNYELDTVQNHINTGLKIAGPKDNGAVWAIAQNMRMDVQAYNAVTQSLNRTLSVVDTSIAAGTTISDLLKEMKEKALAARDPTIDANSREAYNADFVALHAANPTGRNPNYSRRLTRKSPLTRPGRYRGRRDPAVLQKFGQPILRSGQARSSSIIGTYC